MKVVPISKYLNEFDTENSSEYVPPVCPEQLTEPVDDPAPADLARNLEEKYLAGVQEGEQRAKLEYEQRLADQEKKLSAQNEVEISSLHDQLAQQMTRQLDDGLGELETILADTLAEIIKPIFSNALKCKIIEELKVTIVGILRDSESCLLTIRGPVELLKSLEASLDETASQFKFIENNDLEVSVDFDQVRIESRFQLWSELLESGAK